MPRFFTCNPFLFLIPVFWGTNKNDTQLHFISIEQELGFEFLCLCVSKQQCVYRYQFKFAAWTLFRIPYVVVLKVENRALFWASEFIKWFFSLQAPDFERLVLFWLFSFNVGLSTGVLCIPVWCVSGSDDGLVDALTYGVLAGTVGNISSFFKHTTNYFFLTKHFSFILVRFDCIFIL